MGATSKQIDYIISLAESIGADDGRVWLHERLGISMSARAGKSLDKRAASALIEALKSAATIEGVK